MESFGRRKAAAAAAATGQPIKINNEITIHNHPSHGLGRCGKGLVSGQLDAGEAAATGVGAGSRGARLHQGRPELEFTPLMRDSKCATFVTEEICEQLRRRAAAEDSDSGVEVEVSDAKDGAAGGAPSASGGSALSKLNEETHAYCRGAAPPAGDRPETQAVHG
ncbi:hypothetical protein FJT64_008099 [Amphibalanus amphitrite]|uniref:Uncharacterized protein n=1 Tax=Amphibalanus amphitrite TaxID=1232801 RepID=A0A6A4VIE8_AMPAM|nr:hypothetical protein FJT64_008099 [Amphibalanus amphitrite]